MNIKTFIIYTFIIIISYIVLYLLIFSSYNIYKCNSFRCNTQPTTSGSTLVRNICNYFDISTPPPNNNVNEVVQYINNTLKNMNTQKNCDELDQYGYQYTQDIDPPPDCYYDDTHNILCKGYKIGTKYRSSYIDQVQLGLQDVKDNIQFIKNNCPTTQDSLLYKGDHFNKGCYNQEQLLKLNTQEYETNILPSFQCKCIDEDGHEKPFDNCITQL